jgi:hypothetical protein
MVITMVEDNNQCIRFRQAYEDFACQGKVSDPGAKEHLDKCVDCVSWAEQTTDLLAMARSMPQFDVAEALTQNILAEVKAEQEIGETRKLGILLGILAAAASAFIIMDSDSLYGCVSWAISLAVVVAIGFVIGDADREHKAA